ncbi:MAG: hypothetical protein IJH37_07755 [Clostridia bacterium]|nr:hypothetical protein [Clostridia bacterium]
MRSEADQRAVDAFREYGATGGKNKDKKAASAVKQTFDYFRINGDDMAIKLVEGVYCSLPMGKVKRGLVYHAVLSLKTSLYTSEREIYRKLKRAREIFNKCYDEIL